MTVQGLLILLLWLPQPGRTAGELLPVWQASSDTGRVTLLGSVHLAFPEVYPLRDAIMQRFAQADALVVEVDITGQGAVEIQRLMLRDGVLPGQETVEQYLSPSVWQDLLRYLGEQALPVDQLVRLKPGLLATTLSTLRLVEYGMQPEHGIDRYFLMSAGNGLPVIELESAAEQVSLLLDFPDPGLLLAQTLQQLDDMEALIDPLYQAWLEGDAERLDQLLLVEERENHPQFELIYQRMFDQRNRAMTQRLTELLASSGEYFVVVGAGHLVGQEGIIAQLQRAGFTVSRF